MDSTGVYDSRNASDSEPWSSSEDEEQVIEISSHSRILISPRKTRGSSWENKSQRRVGKRVSVGKRKSSRAQQNQDEVKSPSSQTSRHSFQTRKPGKYWAASSRKTSSDNQPVRSNNRDDISESESDGDITSGREESDSSADSDASFQSELETPVHRRVSRTQYTKGTKKNSSKTYKYPPATSLDDSMQSLGSPTTPGKEMEELKATLKKLARHDDSDKNPILQKELNVSSATALHEYLTAATALSGMNAALNQTRPTEFTGISTRQASLHFPRSNSHLSTGSTKTKSKPMLEKDIDSPPDKRVGAVGTGSERLSFNKKLFSTPPPPFGIPGAYAAGLPIAPQKNGITSGSGGVNGGGGQGSRAVLAALKALQDKVGRLEEERESLKQQLSDAKLTARKRAAELASTEKKFSYELGQTKESARAAYDALRCDRDELKLQLVKSEERRKALQTELQHFQELAKNLSSKNNDLQSQLQISESSRTRLKAEMKESESEHKCVVNELQAELSQLHQEQQATVERNELLEVQFQRESTNHAESRERLKDSEQTVASISQLNEKLVGKVMEATEAANQAMKKNKKLQQQIRPSTLLRPTAASRASAAAASEATSRRAVKSTVTQGGTGVSPARTLKKKKASTGTTSSTTKKPKKAKSTNNMTLLREANLGKEIPFLLGNSVQPSFSLIGNVQDALRRCDTTYVMPTLLSCAPTTPGSASSHRQTAKKTPNYTPTGGEADSPATDADSVHQLDCSTPTSPTDEASTTAAPLSSKPGAQRYSTKHKPPAINVLTASPYASPMQSQIMEDLHAAVASAEKEFKGLNKRYKDLVAQMEANNRRGASRSEGGKISNSSSAQLSQALGPLLDELEAKANQLNLLKQVYQQAASSTINPQRHVVQSPEAIRRKTASLRVLNEYRQLECDSKNKGSGRSASPPAHSFFG